MDAQSFFQYGEIDLQPHEAVPLPIVQAGISKLSDDAPERYVVVLVVDVSERPDISGVFEAHRSHPEGECSGLWAFWPEDGKSLSLFVTFKSPGQAKAVLSFDLIRHGTLVDQIIQTGLLQLVPRREHEEVDLSADVGWPAMTIEVSAEDIAHEWDTIWSTTLARELELPVEQAEDLRDAWRKATLLQLRFPDMPPFHKIAGAFINEEGNQAIFISNELLVNQLRKEGPKIAETFDQLFDSELRELSAEFSDLSAYVVPSILRSARSGDRLELLCGQLIGNALHTCVAATELVRLGYRLQPGMLLRTATELAAFAAYLFLNPKELGRCLAGKTPVEDALRATKQVVPFLGRAYGLLSSEYTHVGHLHYQLQTPLHYETEDDEAAKTNLLGSHMVLLLVGIVAELIFFDSVDRHRYWKSAQPGEYLYEMLPDRQQQLDEILGRLALAQQHE